MATQFADLYERFYGTNSYEVLFDLAVGNKPQALHRQGTFNVASIFVLREFQNYRVKKVPSEHDVQKIYTLFPDARMKFFIHEGKTLAEAGGLQDGKSYRYGLVHLGGKDRDDLFERFKLCERYLDFQFEK